MKSVSISSFEIVQLMIICKHIAEVVWKLIVHKFIPKFQALDIKYTFTFNRCNCLKSGSVCALYRQFVIIRRARFCSFDMRSHSKHHNTPLWNRNVHIFVPMWCLLWDTEEVGFVRLVYCPDGRDFALLETKDSFNSFQVISMKPISIWLQWLWWNAFSPQ